jgi:VanZ family protein
MSTPGSRGVGFVLNIVPAILYVVAVFVGGSLGHSSMEHVPFATRDKLLHFLAFGGMVILVWRAVRFEWPRLEPSRHALTAAAISCALGGLLELYQAALPHRSADWGDWAADCLGALAAAGVVFVSGRL